MTVASPESDHAERENTVRQLKLGFDLERERKLSLELSSDQTREIVLLMAQAIVAVHRGARDEEVSEGVDDVDE